MSRSNPYKKKRRAAEKSILLFGEGLTEEQFLKFLRNLYSPGKNINVKIQKGTGGSSEKVVTQASRVPGGYSRRIAVIDNDRGRKEMDRAVISARRFQIEILTSTPCLEGLILSIINDGKNYLACKSSLCKAEFESYFKDKRNPIESEDFKKILKKSLLDKIRKRITELDKLLLILEGN